MRDAELPGPATELAEAPEERPVRAEARDTARRTLIGVPLGDEDLPVRRDDHVVRLVERLGWRAGLAGRPDHHEDLSFRRELHDLVPLAPRIWRALELGGTGCPAVRRPDVPVAVYEEPVRAHEHVGSEARKEVALGIEAHDGRVVRVHAVVAPAALMHPDVSAVGVHVDAAHASPRPALREHAPVTVRHVLGVRLHRIRRAVRGRVLGAAAACQQK